MKRRTLLAFLLLPDAVQAHSYKFGNVLIGHAWGLPSKDGETQIFMPLLNVGAAADTLMSAACENAKSTELRLTNDYTKPPETGFVLEPNKPFPMRLPAKHIRLLGLTKPVVVGDNVSITLKFDHAGETKIEVHIQERPSE